MRVFSGLLYVAVVLVCGGVVHAAPFVVFPKAGALPSPDGRFIIHTVARQALPAQMVGSAESLVLEDRATGNSRKLCDYLGLAAVAWANSQFIIMTQYVSKHTSRALVFTADDSREPVLIDQPLLTRIAPVELRPQLRESDHVFVEVSRVQQETLTLRIWGYGKHPTQGFRWSCEYSLFTGGISCSDAPPPDR